MNILFLKFAQNVQIFKIKRCSFPLFPSNNMPHLLLVLLFNL